MTDTLRARVAAVQLAHMPNDYERDMGECPCGFKYQKWSELASHVADAVIAELGIYEDEDDPYEAKADAERQQWADDEGMPR